MNEKADIFILPYLDKSDQFKIQMGKSPFLSFKKCNQFLNLVNKDWYNIVNS